MSENFWIDIVDIEDFYAANPKLKQGIVVLDRKLADSHMKEMQKSRDVRRDKKVEASIHINEVDSDEEPSLIIDEEANSQQTDEKFIKNLDEIATDDENPGSSVQNSRSTSNLISIQNSILLEHTMPPLSKKVADVIESTCNDLENDEEGIRMPSLQFGGKHFKLKSNFGTTFNENVKDHESKYFGTTDSLIGINKVSTPSPNYYIDTLSYPTDAPIEKEKKGKNERGQKSLVVDVFEIDETDILYLESTTENLIGKIEVFPDKTPKGQYTPTAQDQDDDILQLAVDDDFGEDAVEKPLVRTDGENTSKGSIPPAYSTVLNNLYGNTSSSNSNRFSKKSKNPENKVGTVLEWNMPKPNTQPSTSGTGSTSAMNKKRCLSPGSKLDGGNNKRRKWNINDCQPQNNRPLMEIQSPWNQQIASSNISPEYQNIMSTFGSLCRQQMHSACPNPYLCQSNHNFPPHSWIDLKISRITDQELIRFAEICFKNSTCFNMYFPALSKQLSSRNMKQSLIDAIKVCERPGYYVTHYKWVVDGLIKAQETPVKAIRMLLSHCTRNDTRALGVIVDIIIKNHRDYNFLNELIQIAANPNFECTAQTFHTLVSNAIKYPDQRWELLIGKLADNMREDVKDEIDKELLLHFLNFVQSH